MKDSKGQTWVQISMKSKKLEEISKRIQEQVENYISTKETRIDRSEEKLKYLYELMILEYIDKPEDMEKFTEEMIYSLEVWKEFRRRVKEEIFLDILANVIHNIMKNIDDEKIKSITEKVLSDYDSSEVFENIEEDLENSWEKVLSGYYTKQSQEHKYTIIVNSSLEVDSKENKQYRKWKFLA